MIIVSGTEPGEVDIDAINYPSSMAIKEAAVTMLQSSTKQNEFLNATRWKESVKNGDLQLERTTLFWPAPRQEDDTATSDSTASVETDGE